MPPLTAPQPADNDTNGRRRHQRQTIVVNFEVLELGAHAVPLHPRVDLTCDAPGSPNRIKRGDHRSPCHEIQRMTALPCALIDKSAGGIERKAKDQRARDVHDAEVPCLHREGRQKRDADAGQLANRHAVQRGHVEERIDGRHGRDDQIGAPGEYATVAFYGFVINPFSDNRALRVGAMLVCHGSSLSRRSCGMMARCRPD